MRYRRPLAAAAACLVSAAATAQMPVVPIVVETEPTIESGADIALVLPNRADPTSSHVLGSGEKAGIEVYDLRGRRTGTVAAGTVRALDLRMAVDLGRGPVNLVAALDGATNSVLLFTADAATAALTPLPLAAMATASTNVGLCLGRNPRDGDTYLFLLGDTGSIEQWLLGTNAEGATATLVRRLGLGTETGYCAADDHGGLYVTQENVGIWRFDADPETEVQPQIVDIDRLGHVSGKVTGVAIAPDGRVVVSDAAANRFNVYDPATFAYLGSFAAGPGRGDIDQVDDAGGISIARGDFGPDWPDGVMIAADDDNGDAATNYKLLSWGAIDTALGLSAAAPVAVPAAIPVVRATVETSPVETGGDAADDAAVWVDPRDPAQSIVITTQKQSGLYVHDLAGAPLQFLPDGRMNNVDLRDGFKLGNAAVTLVTASNRTDDSIAIYTVDPATRTLVEVANGVQATGLTDPYGLCMYRSARSGKTFVFVSQTDGKMRQWELVDAGNGKVDARLVRDLPFASQVEGCVADDDTGMLYVAEEDVGLWKQSAEPSGGQPRTPVVAIKDNPALAADLEGVGLYKLDARCGYLVVSVQGRNAYAVFDRQGANRYLGSFAVGANGPLGIDGISETDGLETISANLGPAFPHGLMIAQDGRNVSPPENQNFKLVPWQGIAAALRLKSR